MDDKLISADSHVLEPPDLWQRQLPPSLRDAAPVYPPLQVGGAHQAHPGGWDPKERLKEAPGFDKNNWPDFSDQAWGARIFEFYRVTPYWE